MSLDEALSHLTVDRDSAITIGVFDGVHRGHRHLISQLVEHALSSGSRACVVTFENHPVTVLKPETRVDFLIDLDERTRLMRQLGVDIVVPIKFDRQIAQLSSHDFLRALYEKLRMRHLVVGPDFAMGHNRDGSPGDPARHRQAYRIQLQRGGPDDRPGREGQEHNHTQADSRWRRFERGAAAGTQLCGPWRRGARPGARS